MSQPAKKDTHKSAKSSTTSSTKDKGFTDAEKAAMKERAKELRAEARANKNKAEGESDLLARIAEMPEPDRALAARIHEIIKRLHPCLRPKHGTECRHMPRMARLSASFRVQLSSRHAMPRSVLTTLRALTMGTCGPPHSR